jgi:hypothetical protein
LLSLFSFFIDFLELRVLLSLNCDVRNIKVVEEGDLLVQGTRQRRIEVLPSSIEVFWKHMVSMHSYRVRLLVEIHQMKR